MADLTILISSDTLVTFDNDNKRRTIIKGKDNDGTILVGPIDMMIHFIHRCLNAKENNNKVETITKEGVRVTFN